MEPIRTLDGLTIIKSRSSISPIKIPFPPASPSPSKEEMIRPSPISTARFNIEEELDSGDAVVAAAGVVRSSVDKTDGNVTTLKLQEFIAINTDIVMWTGEGSDVSKAWSEEEKLKLVCETSSDRHQHQRQGLAAVMLIIQTFYN